MSNKRIYSADAPPDFKRWRPAVLDDLEEAPAEPAAPAAAEPLLDYLAQQEEREADTLAETAVDTPPATLDETELEALREAARAEGHAAGLEAGRAEAAADVEALGRLVQEAQSFWDGMQNELAPRILELALDLTRHLLRTELQQRPEVILPLVQEMVQALPQPGGHPRLHLQPQDAELVRHALGDELDASGWKIVPDTALQRGDCLIETHHGELNGTLAARWQQMVGSLGVKSPLEDESA